MLPNSVCWTRLRSGELLVLLELERLVLTRGLWTGPRCRGEIVLCPRRLLLGLVVMVFQDLPSLPVFGSCSSSLPTRQLHDLRRRDLPEVELRLRQQRHHP